MSHRRHCISVTGTGNIKICWAKIHHLAGNFKLKWPKFDKCQNVFLTAAAISLEMAKLLNWKCKKIHRKFLRWRCGEFSLPVQDGNLKKMNRKTRKKGERFPKWWIRTTFAVMCTNKDDNIGQNCDQTKISEMLFVSKEFHCKHLHIVKH